MVINVPDKIEYPDTAFIYITGDSNTAYVLYYICMTSHCYLNPQVRSQ